MKILTALFLPCLLFVSVSMGMKQKPLTNITKKKKNDLIHKIAALPKGHAFDNHVTFNTVLCSAFPLGSFTWTLLQLANNNNSGFVAGLAATYALSNIPLGYFFLSRSEHTSGRCECLKKPAQPAK